MVSQAVLSVLETFRTVPQFDVEESPGTGLVTCRLTHRRIRSERRRADSSKSRAGALLSAMVLSGVQFAFRDTGAEPRQSTTVPEKTQTGMAGIVSWMCAAGKRLRCLSESVSFPAGVLELVN